MGRYDHLYERPCAFVDYTPRAPGTDDTFESGGEAAWCPVHLAQQMGISIAQMRNRLKRKGISAQLADRSVVMRTADCTNDCRTYVPEGLILLEELDYPARMPIPARH